MGKVLTKEVVRGGVECIGNENEHFQTHGLISERKAASEKRKEKIAKRYKGIDLVVSASPEGILVSDKDQSSYIKPFVDAIDQQIMFAEKSWGSYRVLDVEEDSMIIKVTLNPGHKMNYHSHEKRDEVWNVISGTGKAIVDGVQQIIGVGDVIRMQAGQKHTIVAGDGGLQLIEVQLGKDITVTDKKKYEDPK